MSVLAVDRRTIEDIAEDVSEKFSDERASCYALAALHLAEAYECVANVSFADIASYDMALKDARLHVRKAKRAVADIRPSEALANRVVDYLRDDLLYRFVDQEGVTLSSDDIMNRSRIYEWAEAHRIELEYALR